MNVTIPPFDKQEVREAVNYALDSRALRAHLRRPAGAGLHVPAAGRDGLRGVRLPVRRPGRRAGHREGQGAGQEVRHEGQKVTVWTNNKDPRPAIADYYRDVLNEIGYKAELKTLDQQVYFEQIGHKRTKAQTGFTDWYQDFPHPGDFFEPLLAAEALEVRGRRSTRASSSDPQIDKKLDELVGRGSGGGRRPVGRPRRVRREREGVRRAVRVREVDFVLLRADGRRELRGRPPGLQERLAPVLQEGGRNRGARAGAAAPARALHDASDRGASPPSRRSFVAATSTGCLGGGDTPGSAQEGGSGLCGAWRAGPRCAIRRSWRIR